MIAAMVELLGGLRATLFAMATVGALLWGGSQWLGKNRAEGTIQTMKTAQAIEREALANQRQARYQELVVAHGLVVEEYEKRLGTIEKDRQQLVVDLRTAHRKLRDHWTCPTADRPNPGGLTPDEAARLREQDAAAAIADADRADAWIIGLQELVRKLNGQGQRDKAVR